MLADFYNIWHRVQCDNMQRKSYWFFSPHLLNVAAVPWEKVITSFEHLNSNRIVSYLLVIDATFGLYWLRSPSCFMCQHVCLLSTSAAIAPRWCNWCSWRHHYARSLLSAPWTVRTISLCVQNGTTAVYKWIGEVLLYADDVLVGSPALPWSFMIVHGYKQCIAISETIVCFKPQQSTLTAESK